MPLASMPENEMFVITKIGGNYETRKHLNDLGFVVDGKVQIIRVVDGDMVVNVKDARVALGKDLAARIMVQPIA